MAMARIASGLATFQASGTLGRSPRGAGGGRPTARGATTAAVLRAIHTAGRQQRAVPPGQEEHGGHARPWRPAAPAGRARPERHPARGSRANTPPPSSVSAWGRSKGGRKQTASTAGSHSASASGWTSAIGTACWTSTIAGGPQRPGRGGHGGQHHGDRHGVGEHQRQPAEAADDRERAPGSPPRHEHGGGDVGERRGERAMTPACRSIPRKPGVQGTAASATTAASSSRTGARWKRRGVGLRPAQRLGGREHGAPERAERADPVAGDHPFEHGDGQRPGQARRRARRREWHVLIGRDLPGGEVEGGDHGQRRGPLEADRERAGGCRASWAPARGSAPAGGTLTREQRPARAFDGGEVPAAGGGLRRRCARRPPDPARAERRPAARRSSSDADASATRRRVRASASPSSPLIVVKPSAR